MITNTKKIMVCDDDQGILDVIQMLLETENFTVYTEVHSPNLISSIQLHSPDLLLLDLWMPIMAGDELLKTIRLNEEIKNLPVIILSASIDGSDIAEDAGADAFVAKPFDMNDLISKVRSLLMN